MFSGNQAAAGTQGLKADRLSGSSVLGGLQNSGLGTLVLPKPEPYQPGLLWATSPRVLN